MNFVADSDVKHIKNYVEELEREVADLRKIAKSIVIQPPDEEGNLWVTITHEDMNGAGCTFSHRATSIIGGVLTRYGKILTTVKQKYK